MTHELYECICDTCGEHETIEGLEEAQEYFNEHADQNCEITLRKIGSKTTPRTAESIHHESSTDDSQSGEE